jgi:hypothetical protein
MEEIVVSKQTNKRPFNLQPTDARQDKRPQGAARLSGGRDVVSTGILLLAL